MSPSGDTPPAECPTCFCCAESQPSETPHVILNTLDSFKRFADLGKEVWYGQENFSGTEAKWNTAPLVFAQQHPDGLTLLSNPAAALAAIRTHDGKPGRIVGRLANTALVLDGQPRAEADPVFTDPEVEALWKAGKLSLSSGLLARDEPMPDVPGKFRLTGKVQPNHVLLFVRGLNDQPGDGGAMFLNKQTTTTEQRNPMTDTPNPEPSPIEARLEEMEMEMRNLKAAYKQSQADIAEKNETIKVFTQKQRDEAWNRVAENLPRGWVHGAQEETSRKLFETNPGQFVLKLADALREDHAKEMETAGQAYMAKQMAPPAKAADYCTGIIVNGQPVGDE